MMTNQVDPVVTLRDDTAKSLDDMVKLRDGEELGPAVKPRDDTEQIVLSLENLLVHTRGTVHQESFELRDSCTHNKQISYCGVAPLHLATQDHISFLANEKYLDVAKTSNAGALLCSKEIVVHLSQNKVSNLIVCENPYAAFAKVSQIFFKAIHPYSGVSPQAIIDVTAKVASSATVFPNVFISPGAVVGARTVLYPGCFVGAGTVIGDDCILYPNVVIREGCIIGNRCFFNPGAVIGGEGFGFAPTAQENIKIPQIGGVHIADDVEIGVNAAIDRGTVQNTTVGRQTKIDNLVTVGHNAEIGEFCLLAGQSGIAGSAKLGNRVVIAAQAGISGHLTVENNAIIGPQSGVTKTVPSGETWLGSPAKSIKEYARWLAVLNRFVKEKDKKK